MAWRTITNLDKPYIVDGTKYRVRIEGEERKDGTWSGRVAFIAGKNVVRTGQETSQPNRKALEYWATGLEPVYLDGAFERANED
ncbi:MAG TPA: hypothetical protein VGK31_05600 [Thermoanaerobaculia bacterium]|jgi:hypothetical protein